MDDLKVGSAKFESATESASGAAGRKGSCKFVVSVDGAVAMIESDFAEQAYDVAFDKVEIGKGLTVQAVSVRRGAENEMASAIVFAVPESACDMLAKAMRQVGSYGQLVLTPNQLAFDLVAKAE